MLEFSPSIKGNVKKFHRKCPAPFSFFLTPHLSSRGINSQFTSRRIKPLSIFLAPTNRKKKRRVSAGPEIIAFRPTIEVKPQASSFHSDHSTNTNIRRMLRIDCFQFHVFLKSTRCFAFKINTWILLQKKETILVHFQSRWAVFSWFRGFVFFWLVWSISLFNQLRTWLKCLTIVVFAVLFAGFFFIDRFWLQHLKSLATTVTRGYRVLTKDKIVSPKNWLWMKLLVPRGNNLSLSLAACVVGF